MKNYLSLVLALSVVSSPAFASRARLESLGEAQNGSYYIDDARNIFLNPAQIVHYKKKLWLEEGTEPAYNGGTTITNVTPGGTGATGTAVNGMDQSVTHNRAQGGFSNTFGDFTYGLYMNQTSQKTLQNVAAANGVMTLGATNNYFVAPESSIEAFFAGEAAVNWGVSAWWAGNDNTDTGVTHRAKQVGVRLGVEAGALQVFATVGLMSKSYTDQNYNGNTSAADINGKVGVEAGATYKINDMTVFGKFLSVGSDVENVLPAGANAEIRDLAFGLGAGWKHEMTKSTNMFARFEGDWEKLAISGVAAKVWNVPLVLGAETQALSWLTIRGSIQESLLGEEYGNTPGTNASIRNSLAGTTTVAFGLGLTFGDVQIDGLVATNGLANSTNSQTGGNLAGFGTAPQSNTGFGFGENMLTRLAVTYNF